MLNLFAFILREKNWRIIACNIPSRLNSETIRVFVAVLTEEEKERENERCGMDFMIIRLNVRSPVNVYIYFAWL